MSEAHENKQPFGQLQLAHRYVVSCFLVSLAKSAAQPAPTSRIDSELNDAHFHLTKR